MKIKLLILISALFCLSACEETKPDRPNTDLDGDMTVEVGSVVGDTRILKLDLEDNWELKTDTKWLQVSPASGFAGKAEITVKALKENASPIERLGSFIIKTGNASRGVTVVQLGTPAIKADNSRLVVEKQKSNHTITIEGNIDFKVSPDVDWIKAGEIKHGDSTYLEDGKTRSRYVISKFDIEIADNNGTPSQYRSGNLYIGDGNTGINIVVNQKGDNYVVDYNRTFMRHSLIMRFTATWCGYCPIMNGALQEACVQDPNHILAVSIYSIDSKYGLAFPGATEMETRFGLSERPLGIVNHYAKVRNDNEKALVGRFTGLADEAEDKLPSRTSIAGTMTLDGGNLVIDIPVAAKSAVDFNLNLYIVEDGIKAMQAGADPEYIHNNVLRLSILGPDGESMSLNAGEMKVKHLEIPVPENVSDKNNLRLVAFTACRGKFKGNVGKVLYEDYGWVIDNAISIPVNGFANFEYEN